MTGRPPPSLYLDEDSQGRALTDALDRLAISTLASSSAGMDGTSDVEQLEFATSQQRVLVTSNIADFCRLHADFLEGGRTHWGILLIPQQRYTIGEQARRVDFLAQTLSVSDIQNRLEFLSGWEPAAL